MAHGVNVKATRDTLSNSRRPPTAVSEAFARSSQGKAR